MTGSEWELLRKVTRDGRPLHVAATKVATTVVAGPDVICPLCRTSIDLDPRDLATSTSRSAPGQNRDVQSIGVRTTCPRPGCGAQVALTIELSPGEFESLM